MQREQPLFIIAEARQAGFEVVQNVDIGNDGMMRNALQSFVAEMAGFAAADHRRGDFEVGETAQALSARRQSPARR